MQDWNYIVVDPIRAMLASMASYVPNLISALLILIVGWIFAKVVREVSHRILQSIKFESISQKAGISEVLSKGGIRIGASEIISRLVYWFIMIIVMVMTLNVLGLTVASQLLEKITAYVPHVISAIFVLVIGMFLSNVISGIVGTTAMNTKIPKPEALQSLTRWAILVFTAITALGELGIGDIIVSATFNIFFGAICLALALAFGLGGKDVAGKILHDVYNRFIK